MLEPAWFALQTEFLAFGGLLCAILVGSLVLWIIVGIWVYKDAESRGMGGVLWLIVVILLGLIGIIIYLIVRGSHPVLPAGGMGPQPGYGAYPPPGYASPPGYSPPPGYAPPPGAQVPTPAPSGSVCKNCRAALPVGATFCAVCGTKV